MNFNDYDLDSTEPIGPATLDVELIKNNIPIYTSQKLCEMIVCHRYLGISEEISIACMEELGKRRSAGDSFDFEGYIESSLKTLPVLNIGSGFDLRDLLNQAIKANNK
jgi:hypothetical protein